MLGFGESTGYMVLLGLGMGYLMQTTLLISQNSVELEDMDVASSTATDPAADRGRSCTGRGGDGVASWLRTIVRRPRRRWISKLAPDHHAQAIAGDGVAS